VPPCTIVQLVIFGTLFERGPAYLASDLCLECHTPQLKAKAATWCAGAEGVRILKASSYRAIGGVYGRKWTDNISPGPEPQINAGPTWLTLACTLARALSVQSSSPLQTAKRWSPGCLVSDS
jgi:hypothetical protein